MEVKLHSHFWILPTWFSSAFCIQEIFPLLNVIVYKLIQDRNESRKWVTSNLYRPTVAYLPCQLGMSISKARTVRRSAFRVPPRTWLSKFEEPHLVHDFTVISLHKPLPLSLLVNLMTTALLDSSSTSSSPPKSPPLQTEANSMPVSEVTNDESQIEQVDDEQPLLDNYGRVRQPGPGHWDSNGECK